MISAEQVEAIKSLPKQSQGPEIDRAVDSLTQNGRTKGEAVAEVAAALGVKAGTISVGYYRRHRDPNKPVKSRATENGDEQFPGAAQVAKSLDRWAAFEVLINEMVEERVQQRLDAVRAALGA